MSENIRSIYINGTLLDLDYFSVELDLPKPVAGILGAWMSLRPLPPRWNVRARISCDVHRDIVYKNTVGITLAHLLCGDSYHGKAMVSSIHALKHISDTAIDVVFTGVSELEKTHE